MGFVMNVWQKATFIIINKDLSNQVGHVQLKSTSCLDHNCILSSHNVFETGVMAFYKLVHLRHGFT